MTNVDQEAEEESKKFVEVESFQKYIDWGAHKRIEWSAYP